jgi:ribosomal protein L32
MTLNSKSKKKQNQKRLKMQLQTIHILNLLSCYSRTAEKKIKNVVSGQIVGFVRSKEKKLICKKNC